MKNIVKITACTLAEAFSCSVDRNGETNTVIITQK